jgi:hypothetical protein
METKQAIMDVIAVSKAKGVRRGRICSLLQIQERRVRRWYTLSDLKDGKSGPVHAPHALLAEEREAIVILAKEEALVDDSHRVLTAKGVDAGGGVDDRSERSLPSYGAQPQARPSGAYRTESAVVLGYQLFANLGVWHFSVSVCSSG